MACKHWELGLLARHDEQCPFCEADSLREKLNVALTALLSAESKIENNQIELQLLSTYAAMTRDTLVIAKQSLGECEAALLRADQTYTPDDFAHFKINEIISMKDQHLHERKAINLEDGNEYSIIGEAANQTNEQYGQAIVIYRRGTNIYVLEHEEFKDRFKMI